MRRSKGWLRSIGAAAVIGAAAAGMSGCTAGMPDVVKIENAENTANTITVSGEEEVKIAPDMAEVLYSVRTQAADAGQCQEENAKNLAQTVETLKSLGVEESSIQTSSYGLNPIYNWKSGNQEITGYEMNAELTVSDLPIDRVGEILAQSVTAGVNQISSVNYFSSTYDEQYQEALKGAVEMARRKAEVLAAADGKTVKEVASMEEYGYNPTARYSTGYAGSGSMMKAESSAADVAVMPGEISIEAQINVTFTME